MEREERTARKEGTKRYKEGQKEKGRGTKEAKKEHGEKSGTQMVIPSVYISLSVFFLT